MLAGVVLLFCVEVTDPALSLKLSGGCTPVSLSSALFFPILSSSLLPSSYCPFSVHPPVINDDFFVGHSSTQIAPPLAPKLISFLHAKYISTHSIGPNSQISLANHTGALKGSLCGRQAFLDGYAAHAMLLHQEFI